METSAARPIMNFPVNIFAWNFFKIFGVFKKEVILFPRIQEIWGVNQMWYIARFGTICTI